MQKQKQIELLENEIKELKGEVQELTIINNHLVGVNEEHRKLNGELREEIDRLNKSLEEQRHFYLKKIEKLENHKRGMLVELFKTNEKIEKAIKYIKNDLSLGVSTFGSIHSIGANEVLNILKGDSNV